MQNNRRIIALFTVLIFTLALVFPVLYIINETDHNCSGIDCQICEQVNVCMHFFDNFTPDPNEGIFILSACFAVVFCIGSVVVSKKLNTLVNLKVKLSN